MPLDRDARNALEAALLGLDAQWRVLANLSLGAANDPARADYVLLHSARGIALLDLAPPANDPEPPLRRFLAQERWTDFYPGRLPIVRLVIASPREAASLGERLDAAFAAEEPLDIADADWPDALSALVTALQSPRAWFGTATAEPVNCDPDADEAHFAVPAAIPVAAPDAEGPQGREASEDPPNRIVPNPPARTHWPRWQTVIATVSLATFGYLYQSLPEQPALAPPAVEVAVRPAPQPVLPPPAPVAALPRAGAEPEDGRSGSTTGAAPDDAAPAPTTAAVPPSPGANAAAPNTGKPANNAEPRRDTKVASLPPPVRPQSGAAASSPTPDGAAPPPSTTAVPSSPVAEAAAPASGAVEKPAKATEPQSSVTVASLPPPVPTQPAVAEPSANEGRPNAQIHRPVVRPAQATPAHHHHARDVRPAMESRRAPTAAPKTEEPPAPTKSADAVQPNAPATQVAVADLIHRNCRRYDSRVTVLGTPRDVAGFACQASDGSWQIVSEAPQGGP